MILLRCSSRPTFDLAGGRGPYHWLRVGKENLHVAGLVGAAMCSASHDGVSVKD